MREKKNMKECIIIIFTSDQKKEEVGNHEKDFQGPSATILSKMVHSELWHFFLMKFQYVIPSSEYTNCYNQKN